MLDQLHLQHAALAKPVFIATRLASLLFLEGEGVRKVDGNEGLGKFNSARKEKIVG